jgi:hypothetical protein
VPIQVSASDASTVHGCREPEESVKELSCLSEKTRRGQRHHEAQRGEGVRESRRGPGSGCECVSPSQALYVLLQRSTTSVDVASLVFTRAHRALNSVAHTHPPTQRDTSEDTRTPLQLFEEDNLLHTFHYLNRQSSCHCRLQSIIKQYNGKHSPAVEPSEGRACNQGVEWRFLVPRLPRIAVHWHPEQEHEQHHQVIFLLVGAI